MFKITPIQEKERQREICETCGAAFRQDALAYQMIDINSGDLMGMSQFEIGNEGYIFDLKEAPSHEDFEAMFILGRATMNFIDLCDVHSCRASITAGAKRLMISIGFKDDNGEYFCDMTGMFDGKCGGQKE